MVIPTPEENQPAQMQILGVATQQYAIYKKYINWADNKRLCSDSVGYAKALVFGVRTAVFNLLREQDINANGI